MSFAKFASLLTAKKLYFASLDSFDDNFEGTSTTLNRLFDVGGFQALHNLVNVTMPLSFGLEVPSVEQRAQAQKKAQEDLVESQRMATVFGTFTIVDEKTHAHLTSRQRAWLDVSCWHRGVDESLAMWKIYGGVAESVCLQSSVEKLSESLTLPPGHSSLVAEVSYIDHYEDVITANHLLGPATHKMKPYEYEKEIRAIVWAPDSDIEKERGSKGSLLDVDPSKLITRVYLSPKAASWFESLVRSSLELAGLPDVIERSKLDRRPM
jgi:hypothetical protein